MCETCCLVCPTRVSIASLRHPHTGSWGLRDYGTGSWEGGDADCDHSTGKGSNVKQTKHPNADNYPASSPHRGGGGDHCERCGARRTDAQIGLEPTPQEFVAALVDVFREIRRVLAPHGTVWLNLGDSYAADHAQKRSKVDELGRSLNTGIHASVPGSKAGETRGTPQGLKPKDLVGIPWRVALGLQDDGWWLRSDIIWAKPNPMPEAVTDRPTKSHEYVFMLTKQPRYYFDQEAVRESYVPDDRKKTTVQGANGSVQHRDGERWPNSGRNIRSVWEIATQPYSEAHFATFPEELPRKAIKAGCPEWVCRTCDKPRERLVEKDETVYARHIRESGETWRDLNERHREQGKAVRGTGKNTPGTLNPAASTTVGWSDCGHDDYRPGVVLDPFMGAGTTALVARKLGRHAVGVELNPEYAALIAKRLQQQSLFA